MTKINLTQVSELTTEGIKKLVEKLHQATNSTGPKVRCLFSPHGSGKTTTLEAIQEKLLADGVQGVAFIDGLQPLEPQLQDTHQSLQVMFIDEAANIPPQDLHYLINHTNFAAPFSSNTPSPKKHSLKETSSPSPPQPSNCRSQH